MMKPRGLLSKLATEGVRGSGVSEFKLVFRKECECVALAGNNAILDVRWPPGVEHHRIPPCWSEHHTVGTIFIQVTPLLFG
jgi:hypothetical protein